MDLSSLDAAIDALLPPPRGLFHGGAWVAAADGSETAVVQPTRGTEIARVAAAGPRDVDAAVASAEAGFRRWSTTPPLQRARMLKGVAATIRAHAKTLAALDAIDTGAPVATMLRDVEIAAERVDFFAGLVTEIKGSTVPSEGGSLNLSIREPRGVVLRMGAFNHPLLFAAGKMAAPLAAGNSVVLKPSDTTPLSTLELARILQDALPPGVLNVVTGSAETGAALVGHPQVAAVGLIGGVATGRAVLRAAAEGIKPVLLELGGKNALAAYPDRAPAEVAEAIVRGMNFEWAGQSCGSTSRAYVHETIFREVAQRVVERCRGFVAGDPFDTRTTMGPLATAAQQARVAAIVDGARAEGARVLCGGQLETRQPHEAGFFYPPTVLEQVHSAMRVAREEIFGPVVCLIPWSDEERLWEEVNGLDVGLTCSIWTQSLDRALSASRRTSAGYVWVNTVGRHYLGSPFGGYKQSGNGREECLDELLAFTQQKNIYFGG